MSARVGVVLSGCGVQDGSEITEVVAILIALDRRGARTICMAPSMAAADNVNHFTGDSDSENNVGRDMLVESARIARGKIRDISTVSGDDLDAIIFPGGYGMMKNLSSFAVDGADCKVNKDVERLIRSLHANGKPIGITCTAPVIVARVLGMAGHKPVVTIGSTDGTNDAVLAAMEKMGAIHQDSTPTGIVVDEANQLVSTPCYMNEVGPWVVYQGAERMVDQVLQMTGDEDSVYRRRMATFR